MKRTKDQYDLTTGSILQKLLLVAAPIMGTQLMQMSYNLTDMFWLGRMGSDAVAASGTAGMFMWLSMAFILIGRMGAEIGVAQNLGRGQPEEARRYAQNAIVLALGLGVAYGLALVVLRRPLVGFFAIQEAHVAADAESYLAIVGAAMPFNFLASAIVGTFNASGNSKTPFIVNAIGLVANMILDPLLIFGLNMGIEGAAIATTLSQVISCALMVLAMRRAQNRPFPAFKLFTRPDMPHVRSILRWSVPIGLESMLFTLMAMITSRFVAGFGADAIAVNKVGAQVESLSWLIGGGYGSALTAFMGQNFGAGKWTRIRHGFRISVAVMLVYGALVTALLFFCAGPLFSIFLSEPAIVAMGVAYLQFLCICQTPQCLEAVAGSTFKGIGRTLPPSVVSIASNVLRVFITYFLSKTSLSLHGIWLGISLSATLRGLWIFAWYLGASKRQPREDAQGV